MRHRATPPKQGLYDPANEHDACGIGFVAHIKNQKSHDIVRKGLEVLVNLDHRGAVGADPQAGDGSGILIQLPDRFLREEAQALGFELPAPGDYAIAMCFLPRESGARKRCEGAIETISAREGQVVLGWRDVPVDNSCLGYSVTPNEPVIRQAFIARGESTPDTDAFERKLYVIRKRAHHVVWDSGELEGQLFYIVSISARTMTYKGMILAPNLPIYYKELCDERVESALALVHQRFSTNTFPSWDLAQPFRYLCHNGEINTLRGNINWMAARRHSMSSTILGGDLDKLWPLIGDGNSDSATFDNALELLVAGGYSLAHAMMLMIPEVWADNPLMGDDLRAFYEYHAALMEPWDGPAAIAFTDGRQIGATLDRNGLRPARYVVTKDDIVVLASEVGVLDFPPDSVVTKWRLQPGKMLLIDLEQGRIIGDEELKADLAGAKPYQTWLDNSQIMLEDLPMEVAPMAPDEKTLLDRQQAFGYTQEDTKFFLKPMGITGYEPLGSMGRDIPPAVLSNRPKLLYDYFFQRFAQVTNPPIDSIREEIVMSLVSLIGPRPNLLDLETGGNHMRLEVRQPILSNVDLEKIRHIEDRADNPFRASTLDISFAVLNGAAGMKDALDAICQQAEVAVADGYNILILSDRGIDADHVAIPALLATSSVHHHLIRQGLRTEVGLVVETGEARQVHDFCLLAGYGAEAINPYLAFDTLASMKDELPDGVSAEEAQSRYINAVDKGMLKVMAKMGISTYQSYCGAQIFDAVGLSSEFVDTSFHGTATAIEGVGFEVIAEETVRRHHAAYGDAPIYRNALDVGGELAFRLRGETHIWTPDTVTNLQHAARGNLPDKYREFSRLISEQNRDLKNLRGLFEFKWSKEPIPLEEVEPAAEIVKRFSSGAMSFGSISHEAHSTLAIAMNRIGGRSNTGEGGEERERFTPLPNGDSKRSAIKQVASGRFGVTAEYLVNADELQIKMAQGAKPGEGGQLPGHKVDAVIAKVRHSTAGVGLISPPPHHDIYSIEDLAQLIHDLKNINSLARISVKLVSVIGVGTIAAGVAKAHADHVLISGNEGGTGASPLTSILHAGSPWEIGIAETHQTLVLNDLRGRISVQVDGGFRTGRDVAIGALLGADEYGIATAALISMGCIMMRKCHLNTCPVGIATQDPVLRKKFTGKPEHVVNYLFFVAEELREIMAKLGFRTINEMIGQSDRLEMNRAIDHWKANGLDFTKVLHKPDVGPEIATYNVQKQDHGLDRALDNDLIKQALSAIDTRQPVTIETSFRNINRTVGAMLSSEVARRYGHEGLPEDTIYIKGKGTGGQSFGAFLPRGVTIEIEGDANDYTGKGLSGGRLVVYPPKEASFKADENIIVGNVVLYGATEGECYFRGIAGERFAVRNSGAVAVVEGVGDHGCEYMTGGVVLVLGAAGRNFAAGMSGGIAYVLDEAGDFHRRCNMEMVELESIESEGKLTPSSHEQGDGLEAHGLVDVMGDMTTGDIARIRTLLARHIHYTNSDRARDILENFESFMPKFVKIMPVDFRRALEDMQAKTEQPGNTEIDALAGH
jgi:glutamate synthase (NADPH/NADH) large chain